MESFGELQNTTYKEGIVIHTYPKEDVIRTLDMPDNVSDLLEDTSPTSKQQMRLCYIPSISNKVAFDSFQTLEIRCKGDV